jgi:uncharacterized protein DUF4126
MPDVTTLGALTGLAFVSGMRLYSTVLALGVGLRLGAIHLPASLSHLEVLASTPVLVIAGLLYLVEFVADKVPWVDSLWDSVHTFIRPFGAALLGFAAVGDVDPVVKMGAFLVSGSIALSSHSAKAGTRLVVNHSPEPFSNILLSLAEDGFVVTGVWLALAHPMIALVIVIVLVAIIAWCIPKLLRLFRRSAETLRNFFALHRPGAPHANGGGRRP